MFLLIPSALSHADTSKLASFLCVYPLHKPYTHRRIFQQHSKERGDDRDKIIIVVIFVVIAIATTLVVLLCKNKCRTPQATNR